MQPQGQAQVLTNMVDFGLNVQEAGDAARWQHEGTNDPTGSHADRGRRRRANPEHDRLRRSGKRRAVRGRARACARRGTTSGSISAGYGGYQAIQVQDARRPARLRRGQRKPQGRAGGGVLRGAAAVAPAPRARSLAACIPMPSSFMLPAWTRPNDSDSAAGSVPAPGASRALGRGTRHGVRRRVRGVFAQQSSGPPPGTAAA